MLLVAMGIWMQRQHGSDSFTLVTGDDRVRSVVERAKSLSLSRPMRDHLTEVAKGLSLDYGPDLYPTVLNLTNCSIAELELRFPDWGPAW